MSFARLCDTGLFENPGFDFDMPHPEQVQVSAALVLFGDGGELVAHDPCHHAHGRFHPFRQNTERPA